MQVNLDKILDILKGIYNHRDIGVQMYTQRLRTIAYKKGNHVLKDELYSLMEGVVFDISRHW